MDDSKNHPNKNLPAVIAESDQARLPVPVGSVYTHARVRKRWRIKNFAIGGIFCLVTLVALWNRKEGQLVRVDRSPASITLQSMNDRPMSRTELNDRIRDAIQKTAHLKVVYEDVLGEGSDAWDSHPRNPTDKTNCILWIDQVLAEAYGRDRAGVARALDHLRYYEGIPAFGLRKHYNAHWVQIEPDPLRAIFPESCAPFIAESIELAPERFAEKLGYGCSLYRSEQKRVSYEYIPPQQMIECAPHLAPGYYVLFGVATDAYTRKFGKTSGPMGLVHGMFLEVSLSGDSWIHHASTSAGKIKREKLSVYIKRMKGDLHKGYTVYDLDPEWAATLHDVAGSPEAQRILQCERGLPSPRSSQPTFHQTASD